MRSARRKSGRQLFQNGRAPRLQSIVPRNTAQPGEPRLDPQAIALRGVSWGLDNKPALPIPFAIDQTIDRKVCWTWRSAGDSSLAYLAQILNDLFAHDFHDLFFGPQDDIRGGANTDGKKPRTQVIRERH